MQFDLVIVGGGLAGLALASSLRDSGARIALVEANSLPVAPPQPQPGLPGFDPRVSALTPGSIDFLTGLGAWPDVASARHCVFDRMHVWDAAGTANMAFDAVDLGCTELGYIVENSITLHALYKTLSSASAVHMFCPARLAALRTSRGPDELQSVELDTGECLQAQLVVAADGGNSQLRQLAGFDARSWSYEQSAIVTTVETELAHQCTAWQRFTPQGPLAFLPLASAEQRLCSIVWSADTEYASQLLDQDDAAFSRALERAFESRLGRVENLGRRFSFPLRQNHAVDYVKPGIALIGDAAHVIHPLAGQGVNLGFQDVKVLSEEVQRALGGKLGLGSEHFLRRYQRRRKSDNLAMMGAVEGFKRLFAAQQLPLVWARNAGMRQLNRFTPLKHRIVRHAMGL